MKETFSEESGNLYKATCYSAFRRMKGMEKHMDLQETKSYIKDKFISYPAYQI